MYHEPAGTLLGYSTINEGAALSSFEVESVVLIVVPCCLNHVGKDRVIFGNADRAMDF